MFMDFNSLVLTIVGVVPKKIRTAPVSPPCGWENTQPGMMSDFSRTALPAFFQLMFSTIVT